MATSLGDTIDSAEERAPADPDAKQPHGLWARLMRLRIGVVPLPVFALLAATLAALAALHRVPGEINTVLAITVVGGFACAEVGNRLPGLRRVGGAAILATFVPSALAYYHRVPASLLQPVGEFYKSTNFLYLFITAIVVGSILGMERRTLIQGFLRIAVPLAAGSVAAGLVGVGVGTAPGLGARHTLFYVVVPIMAGGVGEGAIPLSFGYAAIQHTTEKAVFGEVLPAVMIGSLTAILLAGALNLAGKRWPALTGEGRLQMEPSEAASQRSAPGSHGPQPSARQVEPRHDTANHKPQATNHRPQTSDVAAAGTLAIALYMAGVLVSVRSGLPAPIAMLFLAVAAQAAGLVPDELRRGAHAIYEFFREGVVYPLLFSVGATMTPWDKLVSAMRLANVVTIVATVVTLMATGFLVGRWVRIYPIEAALVNATHSGQGGTGDIAILTAANRMAL
ncbi:MAG TPA: 2-hydroxycarboxylate transporter family protein, partial [Chthonomonadaceae bacterium]|nr:2-hydroxycarboxylate transporter family protein [Chthonomonadaceae bacterium]